MNSVVLLGNISKEPELTTTKNGKTYVRFSLAVQRKFKNEKGEKETDFFNCIAFEKTAELIEEYCDKGSKLAVRGRLQTRTYEATDGTKRYATDIVVEDITFAGSKADGAEKQSVKPIANQTEMEPVPDDDLPF